jgi:hypothetical protein
MLGPERRWLVAMQMTEGSLGKMMRKMKRAVGSGQKAEGRRQKEGEKS